MEKIYKAYCKTLGIANQNDDSFEYSQEDNWIYLRMRSFSKDVICFKNEVIALLKSDAKLEIDYDFSGKF